MDTHLRILAFLNIIFGILGALGALTILLIFGGAAGLVGIASHDSDAVVAAPILVAIGGFLTIVVLVLSVPSIIAGVGLLNYRPWARIFGIVLSALSLLHIPFGTILGIYGLWVLLSPETEALFVSQAALQRPLNSVQPFPK